LRKAPPDIGTPAFVSERLAKAFSHPIRIKIMVALNQREMSATMFTRKFPQYTHSQIWGHFVKLEKLGFVERVASKTGGRRRGGTEVFFRANARTLFDQSSWAMVPDAVKATVTGAAVSDLYERIAEAIEAGTIDIRPDRHFSWTDAHFDQQAWDETIAEEAELFERILVRMTKAAVRLKKSGEEPIRVTVALACFESPKLPLAE
jgi:DNA-binding transcriptional ArsR family regulator